MLCNKPCLYSYIGQTKFSPEDRRHTHFYNPMLSTNQHILYCCLNDETKWTVTTLKDNITNYDEAMYYEAIYICEMRKATYLMNYYCSSRFVWRIILLKCTCDTEYIIKNTVL